MAALPTQHFLKVLSLFSALFLSDCSAKLNVFLDAREVSRLLYDLNQDLYLVHDGNVAPILKTPILSSMIPPINPYIKDIKFRFNATRKVQYSLWFQSSNETIMRHPRANIPLKGLVPRRTKMFRVKFPCTGKLSGEVTLTINISFSDITGEEIWGPLNLALKRYCDSDGGEQFNSSLLVTAESVEVTQLPAPQICNKKCNRKHVLQRFCVSDFAIKARMESEVMKNGRPRLRVRVLRKFKQGRVNIKLRRQLLEKRGQEISCSCSNLKAKKVYLILGKEDQQERVLYVDNFATALEWSKNGREYMRTQRKKVACPTKRTL